MNDYEAIEICFRSFIEGSLVEQNVDEVMKLFCDDLMGIGMGAQGVVRCKEDVRPILSNNKSEDIHTKTTVSYSNMQIRCYEQKYGSICAAVEVVVEINGEVSSSRIGQCASLRKIDGEWKIYMLQATPLSINASELEAYPLSFVEDELESYHMWEKMSELMQLSVIAVYKINLSADTFEQYLSKDEHSVKVSKGDKYEKALFCSANTMLKAEDRLRFIETFSLENIMSSFQKGIHELKLDYETLQPDGMILWLRSVMRLYSERDGQIKGYLYLINIDQQKRSELEMRYRAETDSMTGLFNKEITRVKINCILHQKPILGGGAFLMIDLDYFKQINDTYGHSEGDRVIIEAAGILKKISRQNDIVGRLGGDEFGLFFNGAISEESLRYKAEKICEMIRGITAGKNKGISISCSIGIALYTDEESFEDLYEKADKALYVRKKEQGRNGYTFYQV